MSIWVSRLVMDDDWPDQPPMPLIYRASHLFPTVDGPRGGSLHTAHIPSFLTPDGYDDTNDGEDAPWSPFLRLSVRPAQRPSHEAWRRLHKHANTLADEQLADDIREAADAEDTVILDASQVDALIADLTDWRAGVDEERA